MVCLKTGGHKKCGDVPSRRLSVSFIVVNYHAEWITTATREVHKAISALLLSWSCAYENQTWKIRRPLMLSFLPNSELYLRVPMRYKTIIQRQLWNIILRITNRCHFFVIFLYYMSLPYMFRASISPSSSKDPDARGHTPSTTWTKWQQIATAVNTPDDGLIEARNM